MRTLLRPASAVLIAAGVALPAAAQEARPVPYPVLPPPSFEAAVAAGTRTRTGAPGPAHWQNRADYALRATLDPATATLAGEGTIRYRNDSPAPLPFLVLKLRQNLHREDAVRNRRVEITGGLALDRVRVGGRAFEAAQGAPEPNQYQVDGTVMTVALEEPLAPGAGLELDLAWHFRVPPAGPRAVRMGQDGEVFFLGYWYPQMAVYDDVYGWDAAPYLGLGEHYMGWGSYDVELTLPAGWLVQGTGALQNPEAVLPAPIRARLAEAATSDEVVHVIRADERRPGVSTLTGDALTWRFRAEAVRDFAFAASNRYVWDATRALVDQDGDGEAEDAVAIHALYRPDAASWGRAAEFARFAIEHNSELMGVSYPYPHMTAAEGIISGGMEYPMITLVGGARTDQSLFSVAYHEIAHEWFPMLVGQNEASFTWMDEGLVSYNTAEGMAAFFDGSSEDRPRADGWASAQRNHAALAGTGFAVEPMRHNDRFPVASAIPAVNPAQGNARVIASYSTPALLLRAVEGLYGRERFLDAYRTYARRWLYKHPYPWDLFSAFEDALGEDLDWLWTPTLFETWTLDHGLRGLQIGPDGVRVAVVDYGLAPFPAPVVVTYSDGRTETQTVPVQTWLGGAREVTLTFPPGDVARVEVDPGGFFPDVDRSNNVLPPSSPSSVGVEAGGSNSP